MRIPGLCLRLIVRWLPNNGFLRKGNQLLSWHLLLLLRLHKATSLISALKKWPTIITRCWWIPSDASTTSYTETLTCSFATATSIGAIVCLFCSAAGEAGAGTFPAFLAVLEREKNGNLMVPVWTDSKKNWFARKKKTYPIKAPNIPHDGIFFKLKLSSKISTQRVQIWWT